MAPGLHWGPPRARTFLREILGGGYLEKVFTPSCALEFVRIWQQRGAYREALDAIPNFSSNIAPKRPISTCSTDAVL